MAGPTAKVRQARVKRGATVGLDVGRGWRALAGLTSQLIRFGKANIADVEREPLYGTMDLILTNCAVRGRKDKIWLRKRFCARNGLILIPSPSPVMFGFLAYLIGIPKDYRRDRAIRVARVIYARPRLLRLTHVADALCRTVGRRIMPVRPKTALKARPLKR